MNKQTTCNDCFYHCTCPEMRGICTSFKEKCRFYEPWNEASVNGCMYGASLEDREEERACRAR